MKRVTSVLDHRFGKKHAAGAVRDELMPLEPGNGPPSCRAVWSAFIGKDRDIFFEIGQFAVAAAVEEELDR